MHYALRIMSNLRTLIRSLAKDTTGAAVMVCQVTAVDSDRRTVDVQPLDEGAPMLGVGLQANQESTNGLVAIPREGSYVVVAKFSGYEAGVVVLMDDIESVEVTIGDYSMKMDKGIVLNGGDLGGLVKLTELNNNLNAIKTYVEALSNAVKIGLTSVGAGTAASGTNGAAAFEGAMNGRTITFQDMENQDVKQ